MHDALTLTRRVRLTGVLTAHAGLHMAGAATSLDQPVVRDADGHPYLPGSSLRGALRATLEALLRGVDDRAAGLWVAPDDDPDADDCPSRRLFGSATQPGCVRLPDAWALDRDGAPAIERREALRVDSATGSAVPGSDQGFEAIPAGTRFHLEVFADNLADWELGLLVCALTQLDEGFVALGGRTARGLGRVGIEWTHLLDFEPRELLYTGGEIPDGATHDFAARRATWIAALTDRATGSR